MQIHGRKISRAMFGAILFCFLLPFITVSCGKQEVSLSGTQIISGIYFYGQPVTQWQIGILIFAVLAVFVEALVGLIASFRVSRRSLIAALRADVINIVMLLLFRGRVDYEVMQSFGRLRVTYEMGFWIMLLLSIAGAALNGLLLITSQFGIAPSSPAAPVRSIIAQSPDPPLLPTSTPSSVGNVTCATCGEVARLGARFCMKCGKQLL